jgi:hypothetical protein
MKTILTYTHTRNIFTRNKWKPFVEKYFKDVKYLGCDSGNWEPEISISNWEEIKYKLPKYAIPIKVRLDTNISVLEALVNGQLGLARELRGENRIKFNIK